MADETRYWRRQPLLFGQVREDAEIERWLTRRHGAVRRAVVIASAGCTAISLADCVSERLDAIDLNREQVALVEIKLAALRAGDRAHYLHLLAGPSTRAELPGETELTPLARELVTRLPAHFPRGLQNVGRVDRVLAVLRALLFAGVHRRRFVQNFLKKSDVEAQRQLFDTAWDTRRWRVATRIAFNRASLALGFGTDAADFLPGSFASFIRQKVRDRLTRFPAGENGYAWQALLGRYPAGVAAALPFHLQPIGYEICRKNSGKIHLHTDDVLAWISRQPDASIDFFALSNVTELSRGTFHRELLTQVARASAPHAIICLRGILPPAREATPIPGIFLDEDLSRHCEARDRSLICNCFSIYRSNLCVQENPRWSGL